MSPSGRTPSKRGRKKGVRKPPPHWRKYLTQAELELPPPPVGSPGAVDPGGDDFGYDDEPELPWWQSKPVVWGLAALCAVLLVVTLVSLRTAARDRDAARVAAEREQVLTLRAINSMRTVRIEPNRRSWSATPDATLDWPEPPQMLELRLPVGYTDYLTFALVLDKVDHGRVLVVERMAPDSNKELRLSLNSSALGPGEYRLRIQGYTWRGARSDAGWVRLRVTAPR